MRQIYWFVFLLITLFLFEACATLKQEEIEVIEQKPQISKVSEKPSNEKTLKRTVAIARFTNETVYGKGFFVDENKDQIGKQAMDILSAKLTATEKFILLERADIDKINKELKMGNLAALNISAAYLIVGSVSEFGRKSTSDVGIFSRVKKQEAHARVNVRLIDVQSGQIVYSEEGDGQAFSEAGTVMGVGAKADYDSSLNDRAISAAISKLVNNIVEKLLDKPWKAYILSTDGGNYVISGGKTQGLKQGDIFTVYKRGNTVKNPQNGMYIELPGQSVGKVQVLTTAGDHPDNEVSICSVIEGNIPNDNFADFYVQEK
jgi:curli biogenesis system outer membrane secretion channel CsgG